MVSRIVGNALAQPQQCPVLFFNKEIRNILNLQSHFNAEYLLTESILNTGK